MSEVGKVNVYKEDKKFGYIKRNKGKDLYFKEESLSKNKRDQKLIPLKNELVEFDMNKNRKTQKEEAKNIKIIRPLVPFKDTYRAFLANDGCVDNFLLKLSKFSLFDGKDFFFFKTSKGKIIYNICADSWAFDFSVFDTDYTRKIKSMNLRVKELKMKPDWRMVVGIGDPSVYETSITLHHIYGIPYIPGSAIKGITRHYFILSEFEKTNCKWPEISIFEKVLENFTFKDKKDQNKKNDEEKKFESFKSKFSNAPSKEIYNHFYNEKSHIKKEMIEIIENYQNIFGSQNKKGSVIFFDSFPMEPPNIEPDIMNVHYPDYYSKDKNPTDDQNPNPIIFLTIKNTKFKFLLGSKDENLLEKSKKYLSESLSEHGLGAKTAVGYGLWSEA
ncbi:MAG: type III-B CRISPR module RAMP protein Cmr6 [Desulfobacteraceae bacterium]